MQIFEVQTSGTERTCLCGRKKGIVDIAVTSASGKRGVKTDTDNKKRLQYYNPVPLPSDFLFNIDGTEVGKPIVEKYKLNNTK